MKLKELYIENYGKFSGYSYVFCDGVNQFCEENGFGKTTIASFIKAMFYGLPSYRVSSKDFNDRRHFYPFNGNKFGGNLTFVMDGKEYRIERFFDKKSESGDTLKVFCNNTPYSGFGSDVGKSVFGLDRESFERTVFIDSGAVDFGATGSISAKLNNYIDGIDGETFSDAVNRLETAKKQLRPSRGQGGKISETRQDIADLNNKINNLESIASSLEGKYAELNALREKIRIAEERNSNLQKVELVAEKWNTYDGYMEQAENAKNKLARLDEAYPCGIPDKTQTDGLMKIGRELDKIKNMGAMAALSSEKRARLEALQAKFGGSVPDGGTLALAEEKTDRCIALEKQAEQLSSQCGTEDFSALENKFSQVDEDKLRECENKFTRLREIDNNLSARLSQGGGTSGRRKGGIAMLAVAVIAVILAISGGVVLTVSIPAGIALLCAGVVLLAADAVYHFTGGRRTGGGEINENVIDLQAEKRNLTDGIYSIIAPLGYYSGNGAEYDYLALKSDMRQYAESKEKVVNNREQLRKVNELLAALRTELDGFFGKYGYNGSFTQNCRLLRSDRDEIERLSAEEQAAAQALRTAQDDYGKNISAAEDILNSYHIPREDDLAGLAARLEADKNEADRIKKVMASWQTKADAYKNENGLDERPQGLPAEDMQDTSLEDYRNKAAILENEISICEDQTEKTGQLKNLLDEKKEQLSQYDRRYELLDATLVMLKRAEQNLKDRYISPVKDKFVQYSAMIESALGERVNMDGNFNLTFERSGESRSDRHLSAGQRSICALCFRLALIDNMYQAEEPFIIMDDPFVNIDEEHLPKTLALVSALSKDRQIIYFSCHSSRKI